MFPIASCSRLWPTLKTVGSKNLVFASQLTSKRFVSKRKRSQKTSKVRFPRYFCAHCYLPIDENRSDYVVCPHCQYRMYCSPNCQHLDAPTHQHFCGKSGEINVDYKIAHVDDRIGSGVFALRDFKKNEIIMHERPIVSLPNDGRSIQTYPDIPSSARLAVGAMIPYHGSLLKKMQMNAIDTTDNQAGLFLVMAIVNHDCYGNADHMLLDEQQSTQVRIMVALRDIERGQEIRHHYTDPLLPRRHRRKTLQQSYGIDCHCALCTSPILERGVRRAHRLNKRLEGLVEGRTPQPDLALEVGQALLELYDKMELSVSTKLYMWVYFDLFRAAIMKRDTVERGVDFLRQAQCALLAYSHTEESSLYQKIEQLIESPETHKDYLKLDRR